MGDKAEDSLHENAIGWGILLIVLGIMIYFVWLYFDTEIRDALRWYRYAQMWLISIFVDDTYQVMVNGEPANWMRGYEDTPKWKPASLGYEHLAYFTALTMQPLKHIYIALIGLAALWIMFNGPDRHYREKLGLEGIIRRQSANFPVIAPFCSFNPSTQPPRPPGSPVPAELPPFAEALGPEEWVAYYNIPVPDGKLDEKAAFEAFKKQLGGRWRGAKALQPHRQILLAAFCLKASRKRADSDAMLGRLAKCWSHKGGLQLSKDKTLLKDARKILSNQNLAGVALKQANRHAFVTTAMLGALNCARQEGGVLAPAQFVWLRAHDRTLWYPLNNLGRQSYHLEALGAMSHYRSERRTMRPVPVPKMEDAVETMKEYFAGGKARPIPQLDYSKSKKRGVKKAK